MLPNRIAAILTVLVLWLGQSVPATVAQTTSFKFTSTPTSSIGRGYVNYSVTPADGWRFAASASTDQMYVTLDTFHPGPGVPAIYGWHLQLRAAVGAQLIPGVYSGTLSFPLLTNGNVLSLSSSERRNLHDTGYFTVLEAEYGPESNGGRLLNRFAVDFRQFEDGNPNIWVDGQFRFNSTIPEPGALILAFIAACPVTALRRRAR